MSDYYKLDEEELRDLCEGKDLDWYNKELRKVIGDSLGDCKLKLCPFPHQFSGYIHAMNPEYKSKTGLYDSEGVGKSLIMLMLALTYISWGNKVAFFTLPGLFPQIQDEIPKFFDNYPELPVKQPKFPVKDAKGERIVHVSPPFLLLSYSTLIIPRYWARLKRDYDFLIFDEAGELKNGLGRRFERVSTLMKYDKGLCLVTATPYHVSFADCYAYIKLTLGGFKDFYAYKRRFAKLDHFKQVVGWNNIPYIRNRLFQRGIRRTKEKLLALPDPIVAYRSLRLLSGQRELHKTVMDYDFFENLKGEIFDSSYAPTLKHQQLIETVSHPSKFETGYQSVIMEDLQRIMQSLHDSKEVGQKIVVFFIYAETADFYYNELSFLFDIARVYDDNSEAEKFKDDSGVCAVFGTYKKMSRGYNFQNADYGYCVEISPSAGELSQAMNRIFRAGRTRTGTFYIPNIPNTVYDKSLLKLQVRKGEMGNAIDIEGSAISKV
jgi:hypothetical protein